MQRRLYRYAKLTIAIKLFTVQVRLANVRSVQILVWPRTERFAVVTGSVFAENVTVMKAIPDRSATSARHAQPSVLSTSLALCASNLNPDRTMLANVLNVHSK